MMSRTSTPARFEQGKALSGSWRVLGLGFGRLGYAGAIKPTTHVEASAFTRRNQNPEADT
jgi:hypothetical protein